MNQFDRRTFLKSSAVASTASLLVASTGDSVSPSWAQSSGGGNLHIAPFQFDVTPPNGHSCCGGWIKPVEGVDDPLEAKGFVLLGAGKPLVICAVDWTGLLNRAHIQWREALAEAAGTTPDRVAVHCVHQHNAPFVCLDAEEVVASQGDLPHIVDLAYFRRCLDLGRAAVRRAVVQAYRLTHVAHGQGQVALVAANRRVNVLANGRIGAMRGSACGDPVLRELPEGLIDPWLKTVAFYDGSKKIAACHYYATHPMSYYGDGRVSSDFAGLARKQRQSDEPDCTHIYFTGCAGNIAAGKYNDGARHMRGVLKERVYAGLLASDANLKPEPIESVRWSTDEILPLPLASPTAAELEAMIGNKSNTVVNRNRPSFQLTWIRRVEQKIPIVVSAMHVNNISMLHLPSESFVEYQLRAQKNAPQRFVATAAYGDGGPWYIPTKESFPQGGYEVSAAFCDPKTDDVLSAAIAKVLA